jgi:hypothetical protein
MTTERSVVAAVPGTGTHRDWGRLGYRRPMELRARLVRPQAFGGFMKPTATDVAITD